MKIAKLLFILFILPAFAFSQSATQVQTLTTLTQKFIALYNTADTAQYRAFINAVAPQEAQQFLEQLHNEQAFIGHVDVKDIKIISPTETQTLVQTPRFETWWQVIVLTDSGQRFKAHHMRLLRVTPGVLPAKALLPGAVAPALDSFMVRQQAYGLFNGNVLIKKGSETLYARSFGTGASGRPHTMQDSFDLASVGKLFTAVAVLQLVEQGRLSLTDSVGQLLPELKNGKLRSITVQQLLTHTSGMGDFFEDPRYKAIIDSTHAALPAHSQSEAVAYLPFFEKDSLHFAPGTDWAYSNTGFELLGYIIEKKTGQRFSQYIRTHILRPAGMTATVVGGGAGGGKSTVDDLLHFTTALQHGKLLSKAMTQRFFTYTVNEHYGWGSEHQTLAGETIVGHSGGTESVCNEVNLYTRGGYTVIILSDTPPPFGHFLGDKIKTLLVPKS